MKEQSRLFFPYIRSLALRSVNVTYEKLTVGTLASLANSDHEIIQREAIHSLIIHPNPDRTWPLAKLAADKTLSDNLRADAIAGLTPRAAEHNKLLNLLTESTSETISQEAHRTLNP